MSDSQSRLLAEGGSFHQPIAPLPSAQRAPAITTLPRRQHSKQGSPQLRDALLEGGAVCRVLRPAALRQAVVVIQLGPGLGQSEGG